MGLNRKQKTRIKDLARSADEAAKQLHEQKPKVNAVTSWLSKRATQNGFGEDFEYTLRPRGAR